MNQIESTKRESLFGLSQRLPPSNLQAEQALLGALLANNKAYDRVSEFLSPDHFADPLHGRIFQAITRRVEAGQLADAITLRAEFEHSGVLDEVGGVAYLGQLLTAMVGIINAGEYGRAIHDAWLRRQLIDIGENVVNNAFGQTPELDGSKQIEAAEETLFRLATEKGQEGGLVTFERALTDAITIAEKAFHRQGDVAGLTTGLRDLDKKTGGLHPSDLLILAGRPAMGKTALATKIAFGAARALMREAREWEALHGGGKSGQVQPKGSVAIFSLEMSAEQLATRLLSEESRVSSERIRRGEIGQKEFDRFIQVSRELQSLPLHIDDTPAITLSALRTALPAAGAHQGAEPGGGGLPAADAAFGGHEAGKPGAGDQPDHPGAEGDRQGAGGAGAGAEPVEPIGGKPRGQAAAALGPARKRINRAGCGCGDVRVS